MEKNEEIEKRMMRLEQKMNILERKVSAQQRDIKFLYELIKDASERMIDEYGSTPIDFEYLDYVEDWLGRNQ